MKIIIVALLLPLFGCADMFACKTVASFKYNTDGSREVFYSSCKEQTGLAAKFEKDGTPREVSVDKSSTQVEVINSTNAVYLKFLDIILQQQAIRSSVK